MNAQTTLWVCLTLTLTIFLIEVVMVKKLKSTVIKHIEWEVEK